MPLHPIVQMMAPSPEQMPAVFTRDRDVVVTAGAGTGKTRTLVARYLSLLADGLPLRSVVAITFTEKAAREMRNRVREQMREYLDELARAHPSAPKREIRHWEDLYSELDAARISTIHGLCSQILRAHPAEACLDPRFEVLDEAQSRILRSHAVDETLAWAANDTPDNSVATGRAAALFTFLGDRGLRETLSGLLDRRLETQTAWEALPPGPGEIAAVWQATLDRRQEAALRALMVRADWTDAVATLEANCAYGCDDLMEIARRDALEAVRGATVSSSTPEQVASLARLDGISLKGGAGTRWPGGKDQVNEVKGAIKTLRDLGRSGGDGAVLKLRWTVLDEELARLAPVLRRAWDFALARYEDAKSHQGAIDFDDLEAGAVTLLRDHPPVREYWQHEVQALLVDEFQDTNARQRDLVAFLNGAPGNEMGTQTGHKLFIVGDAKQSIYRFRSADVSVFRAERERVGGAGGLVCALDTSYRAHRALIEGLNDLLRCVLAQVAAPERPWVEPFAPLKPSRETASPGVKPAFIEAHLAIGTKGAGGLERAARATAGRIAVWAATGEIDYGDVAVLCRASSSFAAYEDAFEAGGIPFLTVAGRGFYNRPDVRDLLNALRVLTDPTDDLALVGLLRSPAIGLADAALFALCRGGARSPGCPCLWDRVRLAGPGVFGADDAGHLPTDSVERLGRAVDLIGRLHERVGRSPVADVLKAFLDETHYRAALLQAGQNRGARNVTKLLADAQASGIVGVGEFLEYVANLRDVGAREGEARSAAEGAVQIMSVHAAKGLEFPVVVIGDVAHRRANGRPVLTDPELGVLLPEKGEDRKPTAMYLLGKQRADDQEAAESDRLFYVAATRAREKLVLSGQIELGSDGRLGRPGGWLSQCGLEDALERAGVRWEHYNPAGTEAYCYELQVGVTPVTCHFYEAQCPLACAAAQVPTPEPEQGERAIAVDAEPDGGWPLLAPVIGGGSDSPQAETDVMGTSGSSTWGLARTRQRVWRVAPVGNRPGAPAWVIGSVVHEALAAWRFPDAGFARWVEARARGYGLTDRHQIDDVGRQSRQLLRRFQANALFREMDSADRRLHEVPYCLEGAEPLQTGAMDALYLREGVWTIVDFKTDALRGTEDLERVQEESYRAQTERYLDAGEKLLGVRPRFALCLLNYAGRVEVKITA